MTGEMGESSFDMSMAVGRNVREVEDVDGCLRGGVCK